MPRLDGLHEKELFVEDKAINYIISKDNLLEYPDHWHDALELVYITKGQHKISVNQELYVLKEKDILFISPGDIHSVSPYLEGSEKLYLQIHSDLLEQLYRLGLDKAFIYRSHIFRYEASLEEISIGEHLLKLAEALSQKEAGSRLFLIARLCDIFDQLIAVEKHKMISSFAGNPGRLKGLRRLDTAFTFIEKNYAESISLKDVAAFTGFNEAYFSRLFKDIYGKNFNVFLKEYRVKKCEHLLMQANTITEAALSSGFNSVTTFNRVFKEVKGCTPREFLRMTTQCR